MYLFRGILAITLIAIWAIFVFVPLFLMALVCYLLPSSWLKHMHRWMENWYWLWTGFNRLLIRYLAISDIQVNWPKDADISPENWYLVVSNHQTWTDILVLQTVLWGRVPQVKFFTKQELIWIPAIGLGMFALGFPYVKRATKEQIKRRPELKNADRQSIARACDRFKEHPSTILNFLEGTRFTPAKHDRSNARFERLLNPKIGGVSFVMSDMQSHLTSVLDITIAYPGTTPTFWEFLQGRCRTIIVQIDALPLPDLTDEGDGKLMRRSVAAWVEARWQAKDKLLNELSTR